MPAAGKRHRAVLAYGYDEGDGRLVVLHNLGGDEAPCAIDLGAGRHCLADLLAGSEERATRHHRLVLPPYGYRWYHARPER